MVVNTAIGMITPPISLNLFATSCTTGMSPTRVVEVVTPKRALLKAFLVIVT